MHAAAGPVPKPARNLRVMAAAPEKVFAVLACGELYPQWVVGAQSVHQVAPDWPAVGSRLQFRFGLGPLTLDGETEVLEAQPPHRLVLRVKARHAGAVEVDLRLWREGVRALADMQEMIVEPRFLRRFEPVLQFLLQWHNRATLGRLDDRAGRPGPSPDAAGPAVRASTVPAG
jgi:uncharacterized protein YndB with AHSA1/START domain